MNTKSSLNCDVVIIGAGIGGLTAASLLSKAGLSVIVVEKQPRPGGYLASFKRKGFVFDSSVQWLNQCNNNGFVERVFRYISPDVPKCSSLKRIRRYKGESSDYLLTVNPLKFRDNLISDFPAESKSIIKFFNDCKILGNRINVLNNYMRSVDTRSIWGKMLLFLKMLHWVIPIRKYLRATAQEGLNRYFKDSKLKNIFCSEKTMMAIMVPIGWAFINDFQSLPTGGGKTFIDWLHTNITSSGSELLLSKKVKQITVNNKKATGVLLYNDTIINSQYVIAACDVVTVYEKMLSKSLIPPKFLQKLKDADLYCSSFTVYLGLKCDAESLGFNEELISVTRDGLSRKEHHIGDPNKSFLIVTSPSSRDKTLAPKGKGIIVIHCDAWIDYEQYWRTEKGLKRGNAYKKLKTEFADILIHRVEKALSIDLKSNIEVLEAATPITYWRYTKNRDGSIMGQRPTSKNIKNKIAHYQTPVKNLFLGGHWAEYGGGIPMAVKAATNLSLLILQKENKKEFCKLRDVMDHADGLHSKI